MAFSIKPHSHFREVIQQYDNHYPVGGEPYSALRLFNGDYQNQNFDVSLVTGDNKNNPDYRDNVPGFYFDN